MKNPGSIFSRTERKKTQGQEKYFWATETDPSNELIMAGTSSATALFLPWAQGVWHSSLTWPMAPAPRLLQITEAWHHSTPENHSERKCKDWIRIIANNLAYLIVILDPNLFSSFVLWGCGYLGRFLFLFHIRQCHFFKAIKLGRSWCHSTKTLGRRPSYIWPSPLTPPLQPQGLYLILLLLGPIDLFKVTHPASCWAQMVKEDGELIL